MCEKRCVKMRNYDIFQRMKWYLLVTYYILASNMYLQLQYSKVQPTSFFSNVHQTLQNKTLFNDIYLPHNHSTVFQAENTAISTEEMMRRSYHDRRIQIITDSRVALRAVEAVEIHSRTVKKCENSLAD